MSRRLPRQHHPTTGNNYNSHRHIDLIALVLPHFLLQWKREVLWVWHQEPPEMNTEVLGALKGTELR